jgi:hypothetical protein
MTVIRLRDRRVVVESPSATSRTNRDGIVDIGLDEALRRQRAAEKLEDALRFYRTVYNSNALAELLQCKLDVEQRLINRELEKLKPQTLSAFRTIESLLKSAADALATAKDLTNRSKHAGWSVARIGEQVSALDKEILPEIRASIARLEAEVRP